MPSKPLTVIGRAEYIELVDFNDQRILSKVDTGADISSIWASEVNESNGTLSFMLFGESSPHHNQKAITLQHPDYHLTRIANSFGQRELRYVVKLRVRVHGRKIKAAFTLADRSNKTYPVLIGRRLLNGKFLVDVSQGQPLTEEEKSKRLKMRVELNQSED